MSKVDDLISQGAVQCSRKYRKVFVYPPKALSWVRENKPDLYGRIVERALERAEEEARACLWSVYPDAFTHELTESEFTEFREKVTGKPQWTAEGKEPCEDCGSLGHIHRRDCINW